MSTNRVAPETVEEHRDVKGAYTFNAFPDDAHEGLVFTIAALRLGDHAHLEIWTGQRVLNPVGRHRLAEGLPVVSHYDETTQKGHAGYLVMHWDDWLVMRDQLVTFPNYRIAEVQNPTVGQLETHLP